MIEIVFRNGNMCHYKPEEYTDYKYDGKYFIVIRKWQWIGFYNLDCVEYIEVDKKVDEKVNKKVDERVDENKYVTLRRKDEWGFLNIPKSEIGEYLKNGWEVYEE